MKGSLGNVYGPSSFCERQTFIDFLCSLNGQTKDGNWVIGGDFNLISNIGENNGGKRILDKYQEALCKFLAQSPLVDLEMGTVWFTWNNKRGGTTWWILTSIDSWFQRTLFIVQGKLWLMFSL